MKRLLCLAVACLVCGAAAAQSTDQARELYERTVRGDDAALAQLRGAAEAGDAASEYWLGSAYFQGSATLATDAALGVQWLEKAAMRGYPEAQYMLGHRYLHGFDVGKDPAKALLWWTSAAQGGSVQAQLNLGIAYVEGQMVAKNDAKGFMWIHQAAEHGSETAMTYLGRMYANGVGVEKDPAQALHWLEQPFRKGEPHARALYEQLCRENTGLCEKHKP